MYISPDKFSPVVMNIMDQRFFQKKRQSTLNKLADEIQDMTHELYYRHDPIAPRPTPALEPLMKDVVKAMKKAEKRVVKQGDAEKAKTDMEMFSKLLDSVNHLNKRLDPKPKAFTPQQQLVRDKEIQDLLYIPQPAEETEEQQAMYARSAGQSQMLHRMAHAIDRLAINSQNDFDRKVKYDTMMNTLMHDHLNDPRYHDPLHDHLLAHHLAGYPHSDAEFNEHLAQHMLYHDVGATPEFEYLNSGKQFNTQSSPLPVTESLLNSRKELSAKPDTTATQSALLTNHLYEAAENREKQRRDAVNTFAQNSYDKFKNFKKV